jgi:hypothetical protein
MTEENQTPDVNVEIAKQLGKAALKGSMNAITGKSETSILSFLVIGLRIIGVMLFLCSLIQAWFFKWIAIGMSYGSDSSSFVVWLKVSCTGLMLGLLVYGTAEVISLMQKMERHLRKIRDRPSSVEQ